jgi:hypothetical protein
MASAARPTISATGVADHDARPTAFDDIQVVKLRTRDFRP